MNIFVGSLPFRIEEDELKEIFEEYGDVSSVRIITDKFSGRSKGFGFIEMPNDEEAKKAIEGLNGATVEGRAIVVNEAEEKKERKPGGFGGGGNFRGGDNRGGYNKGGGGGGYNKGGGDRGGNRRPSY
jgi:RNA recognition motif-containing protein